MELEATITTDTTETFHNAGTTGTAGADHDAGITVEEELLVEEISIDGMCGVY